MLRIVQCQKWKLMSMNKAIHPWAEIFSNIFLIRNADGMELVNIEEFVEAAIPEYTKPHKGKQITEINNNNKNIKRRLKRNYYIEKISEKAESIN